MYGMEYVKNQIFGFSSCRLWSIGCSTSPKSAFNRQISSIPFQRYQNFKNRLSSHRERSLWSRRDFGKIMKILDLEGFVIRENQWNQEFLSKSKFWCKKKVCAAFRTLPECIIMLLKIGRQPKLAILYIKTIFYREKMFFSYFLHRFWVKFGANWVILDSTQFAPNFTQNRCKK